VVYGRDPPKLLTYLPGTARVEAVGRELMERDQMMKDLKNNIQAAQERMKRLYDGKHREEELEEGDWVYLKLQPYRQVSVYMRKNTKLAARFYGPFQVIKKISNVACKLSLPPGSRIHPVFHISLLKRYLGRKQVACQHLPEALEDDRLTPTPQAVLETRIRHKKTELLIHWQGFSPAEATWEEEDMIKAQFPEFFLGDKEIVRGEG